MSDVYWVPQPAYKDGAVHPFTPVNQPLLCLLDATMPRERRHTGRMDVWTGKRWLLRGEGYGQYHTVYPIPRHDYACWNTGIPLSPDNYIVLIELTQTVSSSSWRVEPGFYPARLQEGEDGTEWRVIRRSIKNSSPSQHKWMYEWIQVPVGSVIAWTYLPKTVKPNGG